MIEIHTWATPNGTKVVAMAAECGLEHEIILVNLREGAQREAGFAALNSNGKIPVIRDLGRDDGAPFVLAESGAILWYLAERSGRLLPADERGRHLANQWLMFQMSAVGPIFGQLHHFTAATAEGLDYSIKRFREEGLRLLGVLDAELATRDYLVGDAYSVADLATWPWVRSWQVTIGESIEPFPNVQRWFDACCERPASQYAIDIYDRVRATGAL